MRIAIGVSAVLAFTLSPNVGHSFCGFYVSGSNEKLFADATNVVLMHSGTRTVLSMQNDYRGPLEDFAMVVPVPVVLKEGDVKVLPKTVFEHVDSLGSPRLVEYWEQDPCPPPPPDYSEMAYRGRISMAPSATGLGGGGGVMMDDAPRMAKRAEKEEQRPAVPPVLATFDVNPTSITAGVDTPITWTYHYSNQPYPEPSCTVDHGVGNVYIGQAAPVNLAATTTFTLTCANSAGRSSLKATINVVKIEAKFDVAEYQILILSAKEAAGLEDWLKLNGYISRTTPSRCCDRTSSRAASSSSRRSTRRRSRWSTATPRCRRCSSTTTAKTSACRSASAWRTRRASRI